MVTQSIYTRGIDAFGTAPTQQQNEIHYGEVSQSICCNVTLFYPRPYGAVDQLCEAWYSALRTDF